MTNFISGEGVGGVKVSVRGTSLETTTDEKGAYLLEGVGPGRSIVEVRGEGLAVETQPAEVRVGETVTRDLKVRDASDVFGEDVETFEVLGQPDLDTPEAINIARKQSARDIQGISRQEMGNQGLSDAAEATKQIPAVTVKDGQFAFVRGLGERYSQTLVNGAVIPSPEPDNRVIPLDLFPSGLLDSVFIVKTYSPDLPGEFAGGSVQLNTVDVPKEPFFKVDLSLKYVDGTTFRDFRTYEGGNYDWLTFDDGTRDIPEEVPDARVRVGDNFTPEDVQAIGRSFDNNWNQETMTAPPEMKLGVSFGRKFDSELGKFGVVGAVQWGNTYQNIEDEKFRILKNFGSTDDSDPQIFNDFDLRTSTFESELSGVLNFTYEINDAQKVGLRSLYTRSFTDRVREQRGFDGQQQREIHVTNFRTVERSLLVEQLWGEHLLEGDFFVEWRGGYSLSQRDEPDNRQVRYDERDGRFVFEDVSGSGRRDYYQLDENIYDAGLDLSIPFDPIVANDPDLDVIRPDQKIKLGGAVTYRDRDFDTRRFRFKPSTVSGRPRDEFGNPIDLTVLPEDLFRKPNINPNGFVLQEDTRPTDNYEATQLLWAGYGMLDFKLAESLRLETGLRIERSEQEVTTSELFGNPPQEVEADLDETDFLPSFNLTWRFIDSERRKKQEAAAGRSGAAVLPERTGLELGDMQVRLSGSRTVSRPEFRELAEFEFTDVAQGIAVRGNPDLERAILWNADLRWEWFPTLGEVVSASIFYKHFQDPIEQVVIPTASGQLVSWENAKSAELYGIEFEARKSLGIIRTLADLRDDSRYQFLDDLSLIFNYALIESEVEVQDEQKDIATETSRPLQGQPEYVLNLGMMYDTKDFAGLGGLTIAVLANRWGENITSVGAFQLKDEEEQPRWNLDVTITKKLSDRASLRITGENLLNEKYRWKRGDIVTRSYTKGFAVGLSFSYDF